MSDVAHVIELAELPERFSPDGIHDLDGGTGPSPSPSTNIAGTAPAHEISLQPVDRGFGAWSYLVAAFLVESFVWGFPNGYGAFLVDYLKDSSWTSQGHAGSLLPLVGPLASGIMFCASPITYPLASRYPRYRRRAMWFGAALIFASLLGASYTQKVEALVALQGVVYSIGGSLIYAPCVYYMSEWFVERRGFANGVIDAGTAAGGLVLPLVLPSLLQKYGAAKTLRGLAVAELFALCVSLPFIKGRLPEARVHGPAARSPASRHWLRDRTLLFVFAANTVQGLAYFVPVLWLPTYASSLHVSTTASSLSLAFLNGASLVSRLAMGTLSDRFSAWLLACIALVVTSVATFILWGVLSYTLAGVLAYGLVYGCFAGGWSSLWSSFVRPVAKDDPTISTSIFGVLMLLRGIGNILSTPVSIALQTHAHPDALMSKETARRTGYNVAGGQYERMIIYVGSCFAGASIIIALGWATESRLRRQ